MRKLRPTLIHQIDPLQDSPYFRDSLHSHEKELERTSNNIKELVKETKNLLQAAKGSTLNLLYLLSHDC
jgi:hypothetical protein